MGKLIVTVLGLRGVQTNDTFGSGDPYVKVHCAGRDFRTSVKKGANPVFNEAFTFMVADPNTEQVVFKVMDEDIGRDDHIGEYRLSLGGLVRGVAHEDWYLLQKAKCGMIGIRLLAEDFGIVQQHQQSPPQQYGQPPQQQYQQPPQQQYQQPPQQQYQQPPQQHYGQPPMGQPGMPPMQPGMPPMQPGMPPMGMPQQPGYGAPMGMPPQQQGPEVVFATYGGADVTAAVRQRAATGCVHIPAGQYTGAFGDPFPMEYKDFAVVTIDRSTEPDTCRVTVGTDQDTIMVRPGPHQSSQRLVAPAGSNIVIANYGGRDVTQQAQQIFYQRGGLHLDQPPHVLFGDGMPGVVKAFVVVYQKVSNGTPHRAVAFWFDGEQVQVPRC